MARFIPALMALLLSACVAAPAKTVMPAPAPAIPARVTVCGPHAKLVSRIRDVHGENQEFVAILDDSGLIIEGYVSDARTFTLLIRDGRDAIMTCVLVSGTNYHRAGSPKPDVVSLIIDGGSF